MNHAQFKEFLKKEINDYRGMINDNPAVGQIGCKAINAWQRALESYEDADCKFNQVPDIATELEKIINNILDIQSFDPLLTKYSEGFKGALNFIKDKIKELNNAT